MRSVTDQRERIPQIMTQFPISTRLLIMDILQIGLIVTFYSVRIATKIIYKWIDNLLTKNKKIEKSKSR